MANAPTTITPQDFHNAAQSHRDHESQLAKDQGNLQQTIDTINATSWGELMNEFNAIHQEWSDDVDVLKKKITEMAEFVDKAASELNTSDSSNAGAIRR